MATATYYPSTNDGRGHWWENIRDNGAPALTTLGFAPAEITAIGNDAAWAIYAYTTARHAFDDFARAVTAYADAILHGTPDGQLPKAPAVPAFPAPPAAAVPADLEARREKWVQQAKNMPGYNAALGALVTGTFSNATGTSIQDTAGNFYQLNYADNAGDGALPNDVSVTFLGATVPQPSTYALALLGGAGLLGGVARHRRAARA